MARPFDLARSLFRDAQEASDSIFYDENAARRHLEASLDDSAEADSHLMREAPPYRDHQLDNDANESPFHSGDASVQCSEALTHVEPSSDRRTVPVSPAWKLYRTRADLHDDRSQPVEAGDSWLPDERRFGFRTAPKEEATDANNTLYVYPAPARENQGPRHRDPYWLLAWVFCLLFVIASGMWAAWEPVPVNVPDNIGASAIAVLASLPLLTLFTLLSVLAGVSTMAYLFLVKTSVRHLVLGGMLGAPALLLVAAAWSWGGSWQGFGQPQSETDGERETLRWFSLALVIIAVAASKLSYDRRDRINRTVSVIELASEILIQHPQIFVVSLSMTAVYLIFSVPVITMAARLLLVAAASADSSSWPTFLALFTGFAWLWTLGIIRGVQRLVVAGTVGHWYFSRHDPQVASPSELVIDSLKRATGPSLGTACAAALILAVFDSAALVLSRLRRLTRASHLPFFLSPVYMLAPLVAFLTSVAEGLSSLALVYAGVTGNSFWTSAHGAGRLISRTDTGRAMDYLLIKLLLNLVSVALASLFGLAGYLSAATAATHHHPGLVAIICFAVPFWTIRSCSDVLGHAVDVVFICWSLDIDANQNHCAKAAQAFGEPLGISLPR